nr:ribonuclease H-like domain-containing protein [Tanacetum cinerariifolium]
MKGDDNHDADKAETSNPSQQIPLQTSQLPHTVSSIKLHILKKREYDIWAMKMEHYLCHTDYPIWKVIQNGNGPVFVIIDTNGMIKVLPLKTAKEGVAKENERKARTTLLMALPEDHLAKFHKMTDAKEMWEVIKSRFGGNDKSKKMQKYLLKQQFEGFSMCASEGLHKGYDRFQTLLSQLEIHGVGVLHEDANQKFLRSLPSSWSQVALIMRTKPGLDTLSFDDLYNNLRVFERDVKGTTSSSSPNTQNIIKTESIQLGLSPHNQSHLRPGTSTPQLDCNDLEHIDDYDLEEMDLKWQVAMISIRIKKFHKRTGRKLAKWNQDNRRRDGGYNGNKARDNSRRPDSQDDSKALVTIDKEAVDWSGHVEEDTQNFAMMAYSFSNSKCALENTSVNDRYAEGMHAVSPPMTWNYMPSGPDVEIDYSKFTYGPKQTSANESDSKSVDNASSDSDSSVETTTSMLTPVEDALKVVSEPKVWTDALIIKEYESDSVDDTVSNIQENIEKPSFAFTEPVKNAKSPRENNKYHLEVLESEEILQYDQSFELFSLDQTTWICLSKEVVQLRSFKTLCLLNYALMKRHDYDITVFFTKRGVTGIKREYSNARTPQQNRVVERKNKNLIKAAKTMLADSFLPTTFWAKTVNTACYVLNRLLVTKPQNKTPYELLTGRKPIISYLRPFGCHVTILNTIYQLGKFDGKSDTRFLVGYSLNSKAFRVYNLETKRVEENLHVNFLENKPNVAGKGHAWMFDLDYLTYSMNYKPVSLENQANKSAGPQEANNSAGTQPNANQGANSEEIDLHDKHFVLPIWSAYSTCIKSSRNTIGKNEKPVSPVEQIFQEELQKLKRQEKEANDAFRKEATHETQDVNTNITNLLNAISTPCWDS